MAGKPTGVLAAAVPCLYCSVPGCFNTPETRPEISYFRHPTDVERRIKWLKLIGREELIEKTPRNYRVCEDHFNKRDIIPGFKRKTLKKNALPALLLPIQQVPNVKETTMDVDIKIEECVDPLSSLDEPNVEETTMDMVIKIKECVDPLSPLDEPPPKETGKRKLATPPPGCSKRELETENSNLVYLGEDTFQTLCNKFLTKELADIVKAQIEFKNLAGSKYVDFKLMSLYLYHSSPQAYRMLKNALQLPCITNILKTAIPITSGINANFMLPLQNKVKTMTDLEKNCSAVIGSISLKPSLFYNITHDKIIGFHDINGVILPEPAENAYVMMVRGIYGNWKQPVGYALLCRGEHSVELNEWIDGLLEQLFNIGLNVRTFVSNTGNEFINAAKNRCVTVEKPHFFINDRKIYYIFDAPHLIKLVRNFFMEHDFLFQDRLAKYEHIRHFYNKDKKKEFKLAPKLTNNHIRPTHFEMQNLRYATQLLSNSVATGISTYVDFHVIDESGRDTADFIKLMNNLFDCLNSSDFKDTDEYKSVYRGIKSQTDFFNEMLIFFRNLKFSATSFEPKFIEGFQITITSILQLFDDMKTDGYTYLPTKRFNMEVIDNLFDQVKTKSGITSLPTSWQLVSTYRKCFINSFMKYQERKNSADADGLAEWLTQIQASKFRRSIQNVGFDPDDEFHAIKIKTSDYNKREFNKNHCLFEVSHFLLEKCAEKHDCKLFKSYITPYKNKPNFNRDSCYDCYRFYSSDQCKSLLVVPCNNFIRFVKNLDAKFVPLFKKHCSKSPIVEILFKKIIDIPYLNPPCVCFPKTYLVKLFLRVIMYNVIKFNNNFFSLNSLNVGKIYVNHL